MQTFLPYADFSRSAAVLDRQRLGKQRVEAWQILRCLSGDEKQQRWKNHPAVRMWAGFRIALIQYGFAICSEWIERGYKDSMGDRFAVAFHEIGYIVKWPKPPWLGDERLHASHRAALLHKMPQHYSQFGWAEEPNLNYWWPTKGE